MAQRYRTALENTVINTKFVVNYRCSVCHLTWIDSEDYQDEINAQVT